MHQYIPVPLVGPQHTGTAASDAQAAVDVCWYILGREGQPRRSRLRRVKYRFLPSWRKAIRAILDALVNVNADIEIIGSWVWIHGCYEYRELLKSMGFKFAPKKRAWCWHYGEYRRHHKREVSLDEIREKYGSKKVSHKRERKAVVGYSFS